MLEATAQSKPLSRGSWVIINQNLASSSGCVDGGTVYAVVGNYEYFDVRTARGTKTRDTPADQQFLVVGWDDNHKFSVALLRLFPFCCRLSARKKVCRCHQQQFKHQRKGHAHRGIAPSRE